jgi:hypothetical protein
LGVAVVGQIAIGVDSKSSGRRGTNIALELGGGRSQDTATAVSISETTVVDAVGSLSIGESRGLANSVLTCKARVQLAFFLCGRWYITTEP